MRNVEFKPAPDCSRFAFFASNPISMPSGRLEAFSYVRIDVPGAVKFESGKDVKLSAAGPAKGSREALGYSSVDLTAEAQAKNWSPYQLRSSCFLRHGQLDTVYSVPVSVLRRMRLWQSRYYMYLAGVGTHEFTSQGVALPKKQG